MRTRLVLSLAVGLLTGCGLTLDSYESDASADGALPDASGSNADAGMQSVDAGTPSDAGAPVDAAPTTDAGTDAGPCDDADGDLVYACEGDCDDTDPTVYPGAPLICGDGVDNGCGGALGDEAVCMGLGTYVSVTGNDANPGTQTLPVATVAQGLANANTIMMDVDVYVAAGDYPGGADVTMFEGHSILCGYEATGWTRDLVSNRSVLVATMNAGLVFPSGTTNGTAIDGCTIRARSGATASAAVTYAMGAAGTVSNNIVQAGDNGAGASVGVAVYPGFRAMGSSVTPNPGVVPRIEGNRVEMGGSQNGWGANQGSLGIVAGYTAVELVGNTVLFPDQHTLVRGIELIRPLAGTLVHDNEIRARGDVGSALSLRLSGGSAVITQNRVFPGGCLEWCLGAEIGGPLDDILVANNVFYGGSTNGLSAGLLFSFEGRPATGTFAVTVHSNFLAGGESGSPSVGIGWFYEGATTPFAVGRAINNILYAGGGSNAYAAWEQSQYLDPVLVEGNALRGTSSGGSGSNLYLDNGSSVLATITAVNAIPEAGSVANVEDGCSLVAPGPGGDHHLGSTSACRNIGSTLDVPSTDFDGEARPRGAGPDIGPDETDG